MVHLAADPLLLAHLVTAVAFGALALIALLRAHRGGPAGWWAAAAFGSLAIVTLAAWSHDALGAEASVGLQHLVIALFVAFPYLLLRFTASFRGFPRWLEIVAITATVVTVATTIALPVTLDRETSGWGSAGPYAVIGLAHWTLLSLVTVVSLWRAGRDQPMVARKRMRLMSAATAFLVGALLVGAAAAPVLLAQVVALSSAIIFALGLSPPTALRLAWRQRDEEHLQDAMVAVLRAGTVREVARQLLPPTVRILGGSGAALVDASGRVVASYGEAADPGSDLGQAGHGSVRRPAREVVPLSNRRGELVVWTSRYIPFFGREELGLLRSLAVFASLALERSERLEEERAQRAALEATRLEADHAREEATRANQAKNDFLSRMSHELRTPLNAILGFGQILETSDLGADDREAVVHIVTAGGHLLALINDVLDLSRIEAGTMTLSLEPVHAGDLIDDATTLIKPLADSRSIRLITSTADRDAYVTTDRQRCRQILLNLLSNAVKYNYDGGEVQISCEEVDGHALRISIRDSGPGIDAVRQQRMFEPFERLGAENSTVEGTGLGLALTKHLVERMGGVIGVETAPGRGSVFWIDLPVTHGPPDVEAPVVRIQPSTQSGERTLLLVEDNLINLRVVQAMLRRRPGISVLPAMQGSLAIELAYQHQPDLIVLDLHLPDVSGREVLQRLRANPRTRDIPVVIASADATAGRIRQLREEGAFAYLTKPLDLQQFLEVIDDALTRHDGPAEPRVSQVSGHTTSA